MPLEAKQLAELEDTAVDTSTPLAVFDTGGGAAHSGGVSPDAAIYAAVAYPLLLTMYQSEVVPCEPEIESPEVTHVSSTTAPEDKLYITELLVVALLCTFRVLPEATATVPSAFAQAGTTSLVAIYACDAYPTP